VIEEWMEQFKKMLVLTDLRDDFTMGRMIGKGNFAKVKSSL
jgi:Cft2 family RNA processing exonuclease